MTQSFGPWLLDLSVFWEPVISQSIMVGVLVQKDAYFTTAGKQGGGRGVGEERESDKERAYV